MRAEGTHEDRDGLLKRFVEHDRGGHGKYQLRGVDFHAPASNEILALIADILTDKIFFRSGKGRLTVFSDRFPDQVGDGPFRRQIESVPVGDLAHDSVDLPLFAPADGVADCFQIRLPREEEHQDNLANRDHQENDNGLPATEIMNLELLFPIHRHFLSDELFPFWKQLAVMCPESGYFHFGNNH